MSIQTIYALGPPGSHGHQAALIACERLGVSQTGLRFLESHEEICHKCDQERNVAGVVAVENSRGGLVAEVLAHRLKNYQSQYFDNEIIGEVFLPITQCLVTLPGLRPGKITEVLSHPQAIIQCRSRLEQVLRRKVETTAVSSTSEAARIVSESRKPLAAISSELAARLYGLEIKDKSLSLDTLGENVTRFHILSRGTAPRPTGKDRTAILFRIPNVAGWLVMALETISAEDVNVTCIHSVPLGKMGEYAFYCEFEGHRLDMGMLMNNLHAHTESVDVLGSFPRSPLPE